MSVRLPESFVRRVVWPVWAAYTSLLGRVGMALVRVSCGAMSYCCASVDKDREGRLSHIPLVTSSRDATIDDLIDECSEHHEFLRKMLWFFAEPAESPAQGGIPYPQMDLIRVLLAQRWNGGRSAALLGVLEFVMQDEGLIVS